MIDRERRNQLAALIRRYLDGKATAADFEKCQLENYISADQAVSHVSLEIGFYSENAASTLSKEDWDYIQRLLLLLDSNSTVSWKTAPYRLWTQPVAEALLFTCLVIALTTGFTLNLFLYFIPIGLISLLLLYFQSPRSKVRPFEEVVTPFQSIADLGIAYDSANFVKQRYCFSQSHSSKESSIEVYMMLIEGYMMLFFFFLLCICVPPILLYYLCCLGPDYEVQVQTA
ncbi:hypothetical protein [Gimesia sp.]|uniref:hypothetical protein n=1 Tax=Gimesia sp. TaxID=2024833 RepID=UPI003A908677